MLLSTISAPLRPSRTMRVGATRRSPIPAHAGVGTLTIAAAANAARTIDLETELISGDPHFAPFWSDRLLYPPEWLIFGQPRPENRGSSAGLRAHGLSNRRLR